MSPAKLNLRETRPRKNPDARQKFADRAVHGRRADQQSLLAPAQIEQPVGEDMAPVEIGCELNFIHRHESKVEIARHRLDGRNPVARRFRLDFFLARDERDRVRTRLFHGAVIDLAREKPERQADHPARMGEHPLDRIMGLAGIGRPKQDRDTPGAVPQKWIWRPEMECSLVNRRGRRIGHMRQRERLILSGCEARDCAETQIFVPHRSGDGC